MTQNKTVAMLKFFKPLSSSLNLPSPYGGLSKHVPPSSIKEANKKVEDTLSKPSCKRQKTYQKTSSELKAKIAKYAAENCIQAAVLKFRPQVPNAPVNWNNTVRDWKNTYIQELKRKRTEEDLENIDITCLPMKKRGRPLMVGEDLDRKVQLYISEVRRAHATVNTAIVLSAGEGIVQGCDPSLLSSNGGTIELTRDWAKSVMQRMGLSKRKATTQSSLSKYDFNEVRRVFLNDVSSVAVMEDVPHSLIINWDQTGVHFVPVSQWTMEVKGTHRVEIAGLNDKRQMTLVLAGTATGEFLPPQLIYPGSTYKSLPKNVKFPDDWHLTTTPNHWSNEETMLMYIDKVIVPYVKLKRKELKLSPTFPALVLFDHFSGQTSQAVLDRLAKHHLMYVLIPKTCTDRLQPMDLSVNKPFKSHLKSSFQKWYASEIQKQIKDGAEGSPLAPVDTRISVIKPLNAKWLMDAYDYLKSQPKIIINGFKAGGILNRV